MTYTENRILQNDIAERAKQKSRKIAARNTFKKRPIEKIDNIANIIFGMVIVAVIVWVWLYA